MLQELPFGLRMEGTGYLSDVIHWPEGRSLLGNHPLPDVPYDTRYSMMTSHDASNPATLLERETNQFQCSLELSRSRPVFCTSAGTRQELPFGLRLSRLSLARFQLYLT